MEYFYIEEIHISCDVNSVVSVDLAFRLEGDGCDRRLTIMEDGTIVNSQGPGGGDSPLVADMRPNDLKALAGCIDMALERLSVVYQVAAALNTTIVAKKPPSTPAESGEKA